MAPRRRTAKRKPAQKAPPRMKVYRSAAAAGRGVPGAVAAIGKFDGLHVGHQKIVRLAIRRAAVLGTKSLVITFHPHPQAFLQGKSFKPLLGFKARLAMIRTLGADAVVLLPFNRHFANQSPKDFARRILKRQIKVSEIFVGRNFCFGRNRRGTVTTLKRLGKRYGFAVHRVALARRGGKIVSSSRIRSLIGAGRRGEAAFCMGLAAPRK